MTRCAVPMLQESDALQSEVSLLTADRSRLTREVGQSWGCCCYMTAKAHTQIFNISAQQQQLLQRLPLSWCSSLLAATIVTSTGCIDALFHPMCMLRPHQAWQQAVVPCIALCHVLCCS